MKQNKDKKRIYLDTYVLQKDNRIRLPKVIEGNMEVVPGKTFFDVFLGKLYLSHHLAITK